MQATLIYCKVCGKTKASTAHKCPHCGATDEAAQLGSLKNGVKIIFAGVGGCLLLLIFLRILQGVIELI